MIDWKKRSKKLNLDTADRRVWESWCGEYKVEELKSTVGMPTRYLALKKEVWGWKIVSQHRKSKPAFQALDKSAKAQNQKRKTKSAKPKAQNQKQVKRK